MHIMFRKKLLFINEPVQWTTFQESLSKLETFLNLAGWTKNCYLGTDHCFLRDRGAEKFSSFLKRNSCSTKIAEKKNRKMEAMWKNSSKCFAMLKTNSCTTYCSPRKIILNLSLRTTFRAPENCLDSTPPLPNFEIVLLSNVDFRNIRDG